MKSLNLPTFRLQWLRFGDYALEGGIVCGQNQAAEQEMPVTCKKYEAATQSTLAVELARVNRPRGRGRRGDTGSLQERALLAFVQEYGPLGQRDPAQALQLAAGQKHVPLDEVNWCLAHASVLDFVLVLCGGLALKRHGLVDSQIKQLAKVNTTRGSVLLPIGSVLAEVRLQLGPKTARETKVWTIVEQLINANLNGRREVRAGQNVVAFSRLFALAYSQAADWLGNGRFGECEDCCGFFPMFDRRMRFCPPTGDNVESRCAMRGRARRRSQGLQESKTTADMPITLLLRQNFS